MKLLEIEVDEYTTPIMLIEEVKIDTLTYAGKERWQPITVKIDQTDENAKIIGDQLQKQITVFENNDQLNGKFTIGSDEWLVQGHRSYKFTTNLDEWLLEGCWFQNVNYFSYKDNSYMELIVRFDNATSKGKM